MIKTKYEYLLPFLVLLIFCIILLGIENIIKLNFPDILLRNDFGRNELDVFCRFDSRLGRWHKKKISRMFFGKLVTINSLGLRDKEFSMDDLNNKKRIIVLGDSIVWGIGVNDGQTLCDFLEKLLPNTEVINMGVAGYGTGEELLLLKYEGLKYHPHTVVLFFCINNDIINTYWSEGATSYPTNIFFIKDGALKIKKFNIGFLRRLGVFLNENSYIINYINKKLLRNKPLIKTSNWVEELNLKNLKSVIPDYSKFAKFSYLEFTEPIGDGHFSRDDGIYLYPPSEFEYYKVELVKKIILQMRNLLENNNIEFIVVLSPFSAQLNVNSIYYKYPLTIELIRFLKEHSIRFIDLLPFLTENKYDPDEIYIDTVHFTVKGNKLVARILKEELF